MVITGVARGLGRRLAEVFVERGDRVWGTLRSGTGPEGLAGTSPLDLTDPASIAAAAVEIADGLGAVDLLVNCAGLDSRAAGAPADARGPFDLDAEVYRTVLDANVTGPMLTTRALLPTLRRSEGAVVVSVSSQLGSMQVAARKGRDTAYCVSKAALNMWSVKAATALRPEGIAVVMLHPGWLRTDMGGDAAPLDLETTGTTIADTIGALSIDDTGTFIRWDGGEHPW